MAIWLFDSDKEYGNWLTEHPSGLVLNITRSNNPGYRVLHSARCKSVSYYQRGKPRGAFTERTYRKLCADSLADLIRWVRSHGGGHIRQHQGPTGCCPHQPRWVVPDSRGNAGVIARFPDEILRPETLTEGAKQTVIVNRYERNPLARKICLAYWGYTCFCCGLNFEQRYGSRGIGYIHVHHLTPLSEIGQAYELDPIRDLRPLCPNCHAMIHVDPLMTVEELRDLLRKHKW